jgi:hypothetical protein
MMNRLEKRVQLGRSKADIHHRQERVELGRMYKLRLNRKIIAHSATASALKGRQSGTGCVNQFMLR